MVEDFGGQAEHAGGAAAPVPPAPRTEFRTADGHTVRLHPRVTIPMGVAGIEAIGSVMGQGMAAFKAVISEVYLDYGIAWWDFTDERGEPEPIDHWSIARLLPFNASTLAIIDGADALYGVELTAPLASRIVRPSPPTPTDGSTSPSRTSGATPQRRSTRSSRSGTGGKRSGARAR